MQPTNPLVHSRDAPTRKLQVVLGSSRAVQSCADLPVDCTSRPCRSAALHSSVRVIQLWQSGATDGSHSRLLQFLVHHQELKWMFSSKVTSILGIILFLTNIINNFLCSPLSALSLHSLSLLCGSSEMFFSELNLICDCCSAKLGDQINNPLPKQHRKFSWFKRYSKTFCSAASWRRARKWFCPKTCQHEFFSKQSQAALLVVLQTKTYHLLSCRNCKFNGLKLLNSVLQ